MHDVTATFVGIAFCFQNLPPTHHITKGRQKSIQAISHPLFNHSRPLLPLYLPENIAKMMTEGFTLVGSAESEGDPSWEENDTMIVDRIAVMLQQEKTHYSPCYNYTNAFFENNTNGINENWRQKIAEWVFEVVDHLKYDREIVSIALNYLDRVIAHGTETFKTSVPRKEFQLVAVTSLYLAMKLYCKLHDEAEDTPTRVRIESFVALGRGMFSIETLEQQERTIMSTLDWHLNPPTVVSFIKSFFRLFPRSWQGKSLQENILESYSEMATYLSELAICSCSISFHFQTSEIAYATILCALDALSETIPIPRGARRAFLDSLYKVTSLRPGNDNILLVCTEIRQLIPSLFATCRESTNQQVSLCMVDSLPLLHPKNCPFREQARAALPVVATVVQVHQFVSVKRPTNRYFKKLEIPKDLDCPST